MKDANRQLTHLIKEHRQWLERTFDRILGWEAASLDSDLKERSLQSLLTVSDSLARLATCYGVKGGVDLTEGRASCWAEIDRSVLYHFWSLRLRVLSYRKNPAALDLTNYVGRVACTLCYAMVNDLPGWPDWLAGTLSAAETERGFVDENYWTERVFEPFVLVLYSLWKGTSLSPDALNAHQLGPYEDVLANWGNPALLAGPIEVICDYHCAHMRDDSDDWDPEFDRPPFDLVPYEVLTVYRIRNQLGVLTPTVEHPLLRPALKALDLPRNHVEDPVITQVESLFSLYS